MGRPTALRWCPKTSESVPGRIRVAEDVKGPGNSLKQEGRVLRQEEGVVRQEGASSDTRVHPSREGGGDRTSLDNGEVS